MPEISLFTKMALLLTARWAVNGAKPLTNKEFADFRRWLGAGEQAVQSLLEGRTLLEGCPIEGDRLHGLLNRGLGVFQAVDRWYQAGIWVCSWEDSSFPNRFKQLKQRAPVLLFGYGEPNAFSEQALAIVGSRSASDERLHKAAEVGRACAEAMVTVVSGGARGVDFAAMKAGMVAPGTVVGILADSLLKESGKPLYRHAIQENRLCLMSEVHPEARFDVGNAMARNRLAYACADAALIVECDPGKGGTWAGALEALREGKAVYVLQGARAETQLVAQGAIRIGMDFAREPERLLRGERPERTAERVPSAVDVAVRDLLHSAPDAESLSQKLATDATRIVDLLLSAAKLDGWEPDFSAPEAATKPKRRRKSATSSEVLPLFVQEDTSGYDG